MKIAHECPISVFEQVQSLTDYDYALCNVLEEYPQYADLFRSRPADRELYLDNGVFETEQSVPGSVLMYWAEELDADVVVIPDVLDNMQETIESALMFLDKWGDCKARLMGVCQGTHVAEIDHCYQFFHDELPPSAMIAFSYNSAAHGVVPDDWTGHARGRVQLLRQLGLVHSRQHHLLGCALPNELRAYRNWQNITSVDTSFPVMWAVHGRLMNAYQKPHGKMYEHINDEARPLLVSNNIRRFRDICNG